MNVELFKRGLTTQGALYRFLMSKVGCFITSVIVLYVTFQVVAWVVAQFVKQVRSYL